MKNTKLTRRYCFYVFAETPTVYVRQEEFETTTSKTTTTEFETTSSKTTTTDEITTDEVRTTESQGKSKNTINLYIMK